MISIIIPVYNLKECIEQTLDCVLAQSYHDIEVIVVDDGSTDGTKEILDRYSVFHSARISIYHIKNQGVTNARLFGVSKALGEWIGFVDGDDLIEPDMYERLLNNAIKYGASISHCGYQMVFSDGRVSYFHNSGCLIQQNKQRALKDLLDGSLIEPGLWNKLFHKSLFHSLLKQNLMDRSIKINEDLLMNFYLFMESDLAIFEDVCKYHYVVRTGSVSRDKTSKYKIYDPIKVRRIIFEHAPAEVREEAKKAYISCCINSYNSLSLIRNDTLAADKKNVRNLICEKREWIPLLSRKQQLLANMILNFAWCYDSIYRFYARYVLRNPYE